MSDDKSDHVPEKGVDDGAAQNVDSAHTDIGLEYFLRSQDMDPARREAVAKVVLRKIDFCVLPAVSLPLRTNPHYAYNVSRY